MRARDNPFATARVHQIRYRLPDGLTWEELLARLKSMNWRGAIIGPEGAGKTTLLEDFEPRLRERGFEVVWVRLTREKPRLSSAALAQLVSLHALQIILFDGAEQLSRWQWWRFLWRVRRAGGLLLTSHRPGLLPTLQACKTTPELLAEVVADLLNETPETCRAQAVCLFHKHQGNLREALREFYDVWSAQVMDSFDSSSPIHRHKVSYATSLAGPE